MFQKVSQLSSSGKYEEGLVLVKKVISEGSASIPFLIIYGDLLVQSNSIEAAIVPYRQAEELLKEENSTRSQEDKRFLTAYLNFKKNVFNGKLASFDGETKAELTRQINNLDATKYLKKAFKLPEEAWTKDNAV